MPASKSAPIRGNAWKKLRQNDETDAPRTTHGKGGEDQSTQSDAKEYNNSRSDDGTLSTSPRKVPMHKTRDE